jgi:hypothetical protein
LWTSSREIIGLSPISRQSLPIPNFAKLQLRVKPAFHPPEEEAHGRQNYRDLLPV